MKYSQTYLCKTEYVELLALYYLAQILPDIDYHKVAKERKDLNSFPDFIIGDKWIEVTRAIDALGGKTQKAITHYFSPDENKPNPYGLNNIVFGEIDGCRTIATLSPSYDQCKAQIMEAINKKASKCSSEQNIEHNLSLFVVHYECINSSDLDDIVDMINCLKPNPFSSIYLLCLIYEYANENIVVEFTNGNILLHHIKNPPNKDALCELAFELGWLSKPGAKD